MKHPLTLALAAALLAMPLTALAQDEGGEAAAEEAVEEESSRLSWNLSLTSSYMFRGVDLTDDTPAVQGGLDFAFDHGIYVGVWGSNVDFSDNTGPDTELDVYVGWSRDLSDDWNIDLMAARYHYFGARDSYGSIDYNEYFANLAYQGMVTFTVAYASDYGNGGDDAWYYGLAGSKEFGDYTVDTNVGWSTFGSNIGLDDYMDWSLGVSRTFGPVTTTLRYHGVDDTGRDQYGEFAEDKIVLTFGIEG